MAKSPKQWWEDRKRRKAEKKAERADRASRGERLGGWWAGLNGLQKALVILLPFLVIPVIGFLAMWATFANRPDEDPAKWEPISDTLEREARERDGSEAASARPTDIALPPSEQARQTAIAWAQDQLARNEQMIEFAAAGRVAPRDFSWPHDNLVDARRALSQELDAALPASADTRPGGLPPGAADLVTAENLKYWLKGQEWRTTWKEAALENAAATENTAQALLNDPNVREYAPEIARVAEEAVRLGRHEQALLAGAPLRPTALGASKSYTRPNEAGAGAALGSSAAPKAAASYVFRQASGGGAEIVSERAITAHR